MRQWVAGSFGAAALTALITATAAAQTPADALRLFATSTEIAALTAKAKAAIAPGQPNLVQPVVTLPPYTVNLEYRVPGPKAPAAVHETEAEIFLVVEGAGAAVTGGRLEDERRTNPENLSGSGIAGGQRRALARGDILVVPEKTPHWFEPAGGPLVLLSLHVPRK